MPLADRCEHGGPTDMNALINQSSSSEAKIALFRSLFRGREDVYPRRFESKKTGKSGYAPACANEWVRGICEKPRVKCAECPHRRFLSVTDDVIRWHLSGCDNTGQPFVAGVYPLLLDETCFFLAVDFDRQTGSKMLRPFSKCAAGWVFRPPLNSLARDEAGTSGSSSKRPFRLRWPEDWDRTSSPKRWKRGRTWDSIRTTVSFRVRTRCRKEGLEISSLSHCRRDHAGRATASFSTTVWYRGQTSGRFSRACAG